MSSFTKFNVDTLDALAVALAVFKKHNNRVDRFDKGINGNKEDIIDHFVNGSDLELDHEAAELIKKTIDHRITMNGISGKATPDFVMNVFQILENKTIPIRLVGVLAWAPKLSADILKTDEDHSELFRVGVNSRFIHTVGSKVTISFNLLKARYLSTFNSYCYTGHDGHGNLITFFSKKKIEGCVTISAKIKLHRRDASLNDSDVTVLNYVKEIK
jgi:hypothetical protein